MIHIAGLTCLENQKGGVGRQDSPGYKYGKPTLDWLFPVACASSFFDGWIEPWSLCGVDVAIINFFEAFCAVYCLPV